MSNSNAAPAEDFGILVFAHTRPLFLVDVLKSLQKQNALPYVHVWIDGHQRIPDLVVKTENVYRVASQFAVGKIHRHAGLLGFRKLVLLALNDAVQRFKNILVLEDDCFPTRDAVETFRRELDIIDKQPDVFSVYGHHFLVPAEGETITRFQGWGWATTSAKLTPMLARLIDCYSLTEAQFLDFTARAMTPEILARLDVTPPRNPSAVLRQFFAWDETLALLTALDGLSHRKTPLRTIFNFGASEDSSRFKSLGAHADPPFNMVPHEDVWNYF